MSVRLNYALLGTAIGVAGSLIFGGLLSTLLYGVRVKDPLVFVAAPLALLLTAIAACAIPRCAPRASTR